MEQKQNKFHYKIYHDENNVEERLEDIDCAKEVVQVNPTIELDNHLSSFRTTICVKSDNFNLLNRELEEEFIDYWFDFRPGLLPKTFSNRKQYFIICIIINMENETYS